ncbi:MAG: CatA-like O-acetyltransferase [Bacteroidota bacterium]
MKKIDLESWNRKEQYYNFLDFENPFFNICADVNVQTLKSFTNKNKESFFLTSYYLVLKTVNAIDAFKLRIRNNEVVMHERIRGSCPILKDNDNFGYGYFNYLDKYVEFKLDATKIIDEVKSGAPFDPKFDEDDLIHSSVIPWVSFKSFEHARRLNRGDSVPKIVMGKTYQDAKNLMMPVSVSGHHSLMDGLHIGTFFEKFQLFLNNSDEELKQ